MSRASAFTTTDNGPTAADLGIPKVPPYTPEELRALEGAPDGSDEPKAEQPNLSTLAEGLAAFADREFVVPQPEKPAEQRPSTAARLDTLEHRFENLARTLDVLGDRLAGMSRAQTAQGLLVHAAKEAMDEVRADVGLAAVAWGEIVKQAGEEGR